MINEPRLDAYRRIVEEDNVRKDDIDDIALQIEELHRERRLRQQHQEAGMNHQFESQLDQGERLEQDPFASLTEQELAELELAPDEIDFTALSAEQQVRYWSLLSPGEKLRMVRLHLRADREEIAKRLHLPSKVLLLLEEDKFSLLPASSVTRSYYRAYAEELGIEPDQLIRQYEVLTGQAQGTVRKNRALSSLKPWQNKFFWLAAGALMLGVGLVVLAVRGSLVASTDGLSQTEQQPLSRDWSMPEQFRPPVSNPLVVDQMTDSGVIY